MTVAISGAPDVYSPWLFEVRSELSGLEEPLHPPRLIGEFSYALHATGRSLWLLITTGDHGLAHRLIWTPSGEARVEGVTEEGQRGLVIDAGLDYGSMRVRVQFPTVKGGVLHTTATLIPRDGMQVPFWPRDLYPIGPARDPLDVAGQVHTHQRGLRSGLLYASGLGETPWTVLYLQNFSALTEYFELTHTSPADTVGGTWPELGYAPPSSTEKSLRQAHPVTVSDTFLALTAQAPDTETERARLYLDLLADLYLALPHPEASYHDWPTRALVSLRDLEHSPECADERDGRRYLLPYVADRERPPESMVQLAVLLPVLEYEQWADMPTRLSVDLMESLPNFFDQEVGSVVRWLPGERFRSRAEEMQDHHIMDSWYLYHTLLNLSRLAVARDGEASRMLRDSLPFAIRVARRFEYRWPVFYDLRTLEVLRAESSPGSGENDVAGLYALLMLHAYELFGDDEYLAEAKRAAESLTGLGFELAYQMNTTGMGAKAMLRLWQLTGEEHYLGLADICLASMADNLWLWECGYGRASDYHTFFGMLPLRDAPYLAAYEELEVAASVTECLDRGGDRLRPSVRLLLGEYLRYSLHRSWHFYPDSLPVAAVGDKPRNGKNVRALQIPLEDLQDGWEESGQVGQEVYGAGLALVCVTRHYRRLPGTSWLLYSDYPFQDYTLGVAGDRCAFTVGGDPRGRAAIRFVPGMVSEPAPTVAVETLDDGTRERLMPIPNEQGHLLFEVPGGTRVRLRWQPVPAERGPQAVSARSAATRKATNRKAMRAAK